MGLLRDDGVFVLSRDFSSTTSWDTYTFAAAALAPFVNDGHSYTLNMVDFWSGRNSWCAIDNVNIPAPAKLKSVYQRFWRADKQAGWHLRYTFELAVHRRQFWSPSEFFGFWPGNHFRQCRDSHWSWRGYRDSEPGGQ